MNFKVFLIRILIAVIMFSFLPSVSASASLQSFEFRLENWNDGGKQSLGQKNPYPFEQDENNSTYVSLEITRPAGDGEYIGVNTNELVISAGKVEGTNGIESARKQLLLDLGSSRAKLSELDLERKKIFDVLSLDARFTSCKVSTSTELAMLNKVKSESQMKFGQISLFYPEIFEAWSRLLDRTIAYAAKGYSRGCSGADFMDGQDKLFNELLANKGNLYRDSSPFFGPDGKAGTVLIDAASALSKEKSVTRSKAITALEFYLNLQSMQKILNSPAITPTEQSLGRLADKDLKVAQAIAKKFTLKSAKNFNNKVSKKYADKACVLDTQFSERDFGVFSTAEKKTYLDNLCDPQRFISTRVKVLLLYFN